MEQILKEFGVGPRPIDDPFFDDSYKVCKIFERKGITVIDDEELCHEFMKEFPCNVPGCNAVFRTLVDFELHYNDLHRYVCMECKKSRPNARLLEIHIQETHDSFFKVLADRQPMYQCYEAECELKFKNPDERSEHCITEHKFPKHFRFDNGLYSKGNKHSQNDMEVDQTKEKQGKPPKTKINLNKNQKFKTFYSGNLKTSFLPKGNCEPLCPSKSSNIREGKSSLAFIPHQVMQRSYLKSPSNKEISMKTKESSVLETKSLMDLAESLPKEI